MRSSSGGWVSNSRLNFDAVPGRLLVERALDPEVRRRLRRGVDHGLVVPQLLERGDQPRRIARQQHARHVGLVLTPAADRQLHHRRDDRRAAPAGEPEDREDRAERTGVVVVVAVAASAAPEHEAEEEVGQQRDDADHRHREGHHERVVVLDVAQLVGEHAFELDPVHLLEQPGGHRDRRVLRVASGGERVGRGVVDHVEPRLRKPGRDAEPLDEVVVAGVRLSDRPAARGSSRARPCRSCSTTANDAAGRDDERRSRSRRRRTAVK